MRSVRCDGVWTFGDGDERNASVMIEVGGGMARVTVSAIDEIGDELPTGDRRIAYFLGRVHDKIRAVEYRQRPIMPDPKPSASKVKRERA